MKHNHIALTICNASEVIHFYEQVLEMKLLKSFNLYKELSELIFDISTEPEVFLLKKNNIVLELFVKKDYKSDFNFNHICFEVENRVELIEKARTANYHVIHKCRETSDLVFIKDKTGNLFEIKQK